MKGTEQAVDGRKQLARIWTSIAAALDDDTTTLTMKGLLTWMPAHQPIGMIGEKKLSNGARLANIDWRANRLVDALAQLSAAERLAPTAVTRVLNSAMEAVKHAAMLLGCVTHAANNHLVSSVGPDGAIVNKVTRDASQAPKTYKRKALCDLSGPVKCAKPAPVETKAWAPPVRPARSSSVRDHNVRMSFNEDALLEARVNDIGASATCSGRLGSASDRIEQLTRRVRCRLNHDPG